MLSSNPLNLPREISRSSSRTLWDSPKVFFIGEKESVVKLTQSHGTRRQKAFCVVERGRLREQEEEKHPEGERKAFHSPENRGFHLWRTHFVKSA